MAYIRVALPTRQGLQWEIVQGVIALDGEMDVLRASADASGTADVLIVEAVRDVRERIVLRTQGKVLAIDGHEGGVDLYEMRLLGQAERAEDLTGAIRSLTQRPSLRSAAWRWLHAMLFNTQGRVP